MAARKPDHRFPQREAGTACVGVSPGRYLLRSRLPPPASEREHEPHPAPEQRLHQFPAGVSEGCLPPVQLVAPAGFVPRVRRRRQRQLVSPIRTSPSSHMGNPPLARSTRLPLLLRKVARACRDSTISGVAPP